MLTWSLMSGAMALLAWPTPRAGQRLMTISRNRERPVASRDSAGRLALPGLVLLLIAGGLVLSPAVAVAVALLGAAGAVHRRSRARTRAAVEETAALSEAVRTMAGELRTGAHPAVAAEVAATDAPPRTAEALRTVASVARLGGDLAGALPQNDDDSLAQLGRAWSLAHKHGLPLAGVLDAVQRDLDSRVRVANQIDARMAGPRASAAILAVLPAAGVALGEAMGAGPVRVLTVNPMGQVLLVLGAALVFAGVRWSAALTGRVMVK